MRLRSKTNYNTMANEPIADSENKTKKRKKERRKNRCQPIDFQGQSNLIYHFLKNHFK